MNHAKAQDKSRHPSSDRPASRGGAVESKQTARQCETFYERQIANVLNAGVDMLYTAMFDELDEGTAIMKIQGRVDSLPSGAEFVTPGADHCNASSDLYLRLAGEATKALHDSSRPN